jgi:hypothetical protein
LAPDLTATSTLTLKPGVALEMRYRSDAFPDKLAMPRLSVFVVLYLAVVVMIARAAVETITSVAEYCFGAALLMDALHVNPAANAGLATKSPPVEVSAMVAATTERARKRLLPLLTREEPRQCGFMWLSNHVLATVGRGPNAQSRPGHLEELPAFTVLRAARQVSPGAGRS